MDLSFSGIHHVSFDFWLTLFKSGPSFKPKRDELIRQFFSVPHPIEKISDTVRMFDRKFTAINELVGKNTDAHEMLLIILDALDVDILQIDRTQLESYYGEMETLFLENHPVLIEDNLKDLLEALVKNNKTLSILSNTGFVKGSSLKKFLKQSDLHDLFSFQVYSDEVGLSKPSEAMFRLVTQNLDAARKLEAGHVLHIGDNPNADIKGAGNFGFKAALINSNGVSLNHLSII